MENGGTKFTFRIKTNAALKFVENLQLDCERGWMKQIKFDQV